MDVAGLILAVSVGFLAAMCALSAWVARQLPPGGPVPVHFNIKGKLDGFGPRWVTLAAMPLTYVGVNALVVLIGFAEEPASLGEMIVTHVILGAALLATHGFIMYLLLRWARNQA